MPKKYQPRKYARLLKVKGQFKGEPDEVYTRHSKKEFELRREAFGENAAEHLQNYDYLEWTEWGNLGGRPRIHANDKERMKAYRRRKAQIKLKTGEKIGVLNMTTGRVNKHRNNAAKMKDYRLRKKLAQN